MKFMFQFFHNREDGHFIQKNVLSYHRRVANKKEYSATSNLYTMVNGKRQYAFVCVCVTVSKLN